MSHYTLSVIQYPSGRYGFGGSVPSDLAIRHSDNRRLSSAEFEKYSTASNPAMVARTYGYMVPTFNSKQDILTFLSDFDNVSHSCDCDGSPPCPGTCEIHHLLSCLENEVRGTK